MRTLWTTVLCSCSLLLAGCSGMPRLTSTGTSNSVSGPALQGRVHGGQQAVSGASVYLFAANTTGYGNASVSLLNSSGSNTHFDGTNYYVTTDSNGGFSITGDYTCPSATAQVYVYSIGGSSGAGANSAIGLMAALGTCAIPITNSFIYVDEVSTIATAYAIAGYATDATHVSSSGSSLALIDVANAFSTVKNLETLSTGVALTTPTGGNGFVPQNEIDTLANILAGCVNSTGSGSTGCSTLFSSAKNGSTAPTDTATAAINIAHNPGANVSTLYGLATASAPFQPALTAVPTDWTIGIEYLASGMSQNFGLAVDRSGNVWVAGGTLCEFSPLGAAIPSSGACYSGNGLADPFAVAIDSSGNAWVTNKAGGTGTGSISEFTSTGGTATGSPFTAGNLDIPYGLAFDSNGNLWIANGGRSLVNDLTELDSTGANVGSSPYSGGGMSSPLGVAVDTSNNIWVGNSNDTVSKISSGGSPISPTGGYTVGGLDQGADGTSMLAIDASGNVWTPNYGVGMSPATLTELNSSGGAVSSTGYTGGGMSTDPCCVAIDGAGNVWVPSAVPTALSEFNSTGMALSGSGGFIGGQSNLYTTPNGAPAIAIDGSGNIWISNNYLGVLVEVVGAAAPVVTPLVANLKSPYGMHAVNLP